MNKVIELLKFLKKNYPNKNKRSEPFKTLVGTIISQRTKDEVTERVLDRLFLKYDSPEKIASALPKEIEQLIFPAGFYRVKAKRLIEISKILLEKYKGEVPNRCEELISLPGVGRKTANCVLAFGFGIPALPVDTHIHRISNRIRLVNTNNPIDTEKELVKIIPKEEWGYINWAMVKFGKDICRPVKPRCSECCLDNICSYYIGRRE